MFRGLITFPTSNFTLIVGERNTTLPLTGNYLPRTLVLLLLLLLLLVLLVEVNSIEGASGGGDGGAECGDGSDCEAGGEVSGGRISCCSVGRDGIVGDDGARWW